MLSSVVKNTNFTALKHHKSLKEVALEKLITGTIEQGCQSDEQLLLSLRLKKQIY